MKTPTKSATKSTSKRNYRWIYPLLKNIPGYKKGNEEIMIDSLVEQYTGFRTDSRSEMTDKEYNVMKKDLSEKYARPVKKKVTDEVLEKARRRVMAAIHDYCERMNIAHPTEYVIGMMKRSSGYEDINKIPMGKLTALYNYWKNNNEIIDRSKLMTINLN